MIDTLASLDEQILLLINGHHTAFLDELMTLVTGKFIWIPLYLFLIDMLYKKLGAKYTLLTLIAVGLAIFMADQICASLIRPYVGRMRPTNPDNPIYPLITIVEGYARGGYGWPSCHAANTFALATLLSIVFRSKAFTGCIFFWAVLVSYSRIYLGVHFPGDIICGALIGSFLGYLSIVITTRLYIELPKMYIRRRQRPEVMS